MVERSWRERDEAVVSAQARSSDLHRAHQPNFGKAVSGDSQPRGRPRHHLSCRDAKSQATALSVGDERRGWSSRHQQQVILHQLVGHVLAH